MISEYKNDGQLLAASKEGDEMAFRHMFDKYWDDLFRIAYRRLRSTEDAKDVVQDVFLSLWNNREAVWINESIGGYLYTALRNKIFNFLEKDNNRLIKLMKMPFHPSEQEQNLFDNYCSKELRQFIALQVSSMPEKMRQIYLLSREEHMTNAEIATLLGLSHQTIKNQLHNALSRLRKSLADSNFHYSTLCLLFFSDIF